MKFVFSWDPSRAMGLLLGFVVSVVGCGDPTIDVDELQAGSAGKVRLEEADQRRLNRCYLLLREDVAAELSLSGYQEVSRQAFANRLNHLMTRYEVVKGGLPKAVVDQMNQPVRKVEATLDLGDAIGSLLSEAQRSQLDALPDRLKLKPIEMQLGTESFILLYSLSGDEVVREVEMDGRTVSVVQSTGRAPDAWPSLLETAGDVVAALGSEERGVRKAGLGRLESLVPESLSEKERDQIRQALRARLAEGTRAAEEAAGPAAKAAVDFERVDVLVAFAPYAEVSDTVVLEGFVEEGGRSLVPVIATLSRVAPERAVSLSAADADDFHRFINCLRGFESHGIEAEANLVALDQATEGERRSWIQRSLEAIGSSQPLERR